MQRGLKELNSTEREKPFLDEKVPRYLVYLLKKERIKFSMVEGLCSTKGKPAKLLTAVQNGVASSRNPNAQIVLPVPFLHPPNGYFFKYKKALESWSGTKKQKNSLHLSVGLVPRVLLEAGACKIHRRGLTLKAFETRGELRLSKEVFQLHPSLNPDGIKVFSLSSILVAFQRKKHTF